MAGSSPSLPDGSNPSAAIVQSASDVQCSRLLKTTVSVKLKKGNFIADEGSAFVSSLQKGESITEEIRFTKIKSTSDYSSATVRLYWYDSDGGFYED